MNVKKTLHRKYNDMHGTVDNLIASIRKEKNITQEELAQTVGVTRQTIIALEKGNYIPSVLLALKIAKSFKEPVEKIFKVKK